MPTEPELEQEGKSSALRRLLRPRSVALFGGRWVENVIEQLQKSGYPGAIWPVHPTRGEIRGIPCLPSVDALPAPPDAAFVGVNRTACIEVVGRLSMLGAGGATCFASGFRESETQSAGGADLQSRLVDAAGPMPILGPNCYGYLNYLDNVPLWPDQHGGQVVVRGVAIIAQSSNIAINITMQHRALPVAYMITAGNQAQTGMYTIAAALIDDPRVSAVGFYLEGLGDIRALESLAAQAHRKKKLLVALKTGRSDSARKATLTHTASLAGSASAATALFRRLGVVEVQSLTVFIETLKLADRFGCLPGNAICSVSCSGGEASHMADMAEGTGLQFRSFSSTACAQLASLLGPLVSIANPLDYHTYIWGDVPRMTQVFSTAMADGFDLTLFMLDLPRSDRCDPSSYDCAIQAIIAAQQQTEAPVAVVCCLPENLSESVSARFARAGVLPLHGLHEALLAVDALLRIGKVTPHTLAPLLLASPEHAQACTCPDASITLDEADAKAALAGFGLSVPRSLCATGLEQLAQMADTLEYPVALKMLGVAHKSESGAVRLNLPDVPGLLDAAAQMSTMGSGPSTQHAPFHGFLVEPMATDAVVELIVGITCDAGGLFQLTLGAGGLLTELLADTTSLLLPVTAAEIHSALGTLRIGPLLSGYRGAAGVDQDALTKAVLAIATYAENHVERLIELDVNPLLARRHDAMAVDALIRLRPEAAGIAALNGNT